ncbi:MAG: DUF4956 domain-containing protein [Planctomycetes bacterium]|nr:DUF4956 domain-containing protein [Planctomycetota bacterium]
MDRIWQILEGTSVTTSSYSSESVLLALLLAFVLGQVLAWVYYFTHSSLSYSRSFVQSLIVITVVVAMVMSTIQNSFVTAVGLMGALSVIRFRNMIKDTRDISFIFCSLVIGMATGSQMFAIAIIGTIFLSLIFFYLYISTFGAHKPHNGFLRFNVSGHIGPNHAVHSTLKRFCKTFSLISARDHGGGHPFVEYAFQLMVRNAAKNNTMLSELEKIEDVSDINLTMQEQLLEV